MERNEVQRLDLVAQTEATKAVLWRARVPITIVSVFCVWLGCISTASPGETLGVWLAAILTAMTAVMLWMKSRSAPFAMTLLFVAVLIAPWLVADNEPDIHTALGLTSQYFVSAIIFIIGYRWPFIAVPFIEGNAESLESERRQVGQWVRMLSVPGYKDPVVEFSTTSFVNGHWTYRLLDVGTWWAVAKFKTRNTERPLELRVLEKNAVRPTIDSEGHLNIELGSTLISNVTVSSDMRERLLQLRRAG